MTASSLPIRSFGALLALGVVGSAGAAPLPARGGGADSRAAFVRSAASGPCLGSRLQASIGPAPFAPGEALAYELTVAGVYVGRMETKVGRPRPLDGKPRTSLFGRARTNAFTSVFKKLEGRYMTLVDPLTFAPLGSRVEATYGDDVRWEKVKFQPGRLSASFRYEGKLGVRNYERTEPMTDLLALLYFARTRVLTQNTDSCELVYGARWLWRMEAKVRGFSNVETPAGPKSTTVVWTTFQRVPHRDLNSPAQRELKLAVEIYFARDRTQAPLRFVIHSGGVTAEGKLVRWSLNDAGDDNWTL